MVLTTEISVFPNPFDHFIFLEVTCDEPFDCVILLADPDAGRIIRMMGAGFNSGLNRVSLDDLRSLESGQYQLDIKTVDGEVLYQTMLIKP